MSGSASTGRTERTALAVAALAAGFVLVAAMGCTTEMSPGPDAQAMPAEAVSDAGAAGDEGAPEIREGVDIVGFDLRRIDAEIKHPAACQRVCDATEACKAWTLSLQDGGCWLKSGVEQLHETPFAVSGLKRGESWPSATP